MSAKEAPLTGEEKANVLLRSGRLVFLQTVGYSEAQILRLGDLAALPSERMSTLLQRKAEEAIATAFGKSIQRHHPRVRKIGGRKKK